MTLTQRWALKTAIKHGKEPVNIEKRFPEAVMLLLIPEKAEKLENLALQLNSWLEKKDNSKVTLVLNSSQGFLADYLSKSVQILQYSEEDKKKNGIPKATFLEKCQKVNPDTVLLFSQQYQPFSETVYAYLPARVKAAFYNNSRAEYSSLLVKPNNENDFKNNINLMLTNLDLFDQA